MSFNHLFKTIDKRDVKVTDSTRHKSMTVKGSDDGVFSAQYRLPHEWKNNPTGSKDVGWTNNGEYWYWLYSNIYISGSVHSEDFVTGSLHNQYINNYTYNDQYTHKFNNSGSLISIPVIYYGDRIKPKSLTLKDNSKSHTTITIKDDGKGNLYSIGNTISASNTSPSSSDNYIGNIFYETGLINITETGSYKGTWDLSSATYETKSPATTTQDNLPYGFTFKPDGTKFWVMGSSGDSEVWEYTITGSAWNVTNATYTGNMFDTGVANGRDVVFKPDGLKMYTLSGNTDRIYEWDLSTEWDVTTATANQNFSIVGTDNAPYGFYFKPDGLKVYMTGRENDKVYEMNMSTAWDISSITSTSQSYAHSGSISQSLGVNEELIGGITFYPDGTRMYTTGNRQNMVYEHKLTTAWDITTATYHTSMSVASQEVNPNAIQFKPDGTKMYVMGYGGDDVNQYDMPSASFYTDIGDNYTASFKSTMDVKSHSYNVHTRPGEFCFTHNPTTRHKRSGSGNLWAESGSLIPGIADQFTGSGFLPYITTIGLYDNDHELVAVGRLSNPHKRSVSENITYVLKFDI